MLYCWYRDYILFFKQKTAYEMRISDWSSDVCSSDLMYVGQRGVFFNDQPKRLPGHGGGPSSNEKRIAAARAQQLGARLLKVEVYPILGFVAQRHQPVFDTFSLYDAYYAFGQAGIQQAPTEQSRSEERRGGKEWFSTCNTRWCPSQ